MATFSNLFARPFLLIFITCIVTACAAPWMNWPYKEDGTLAYESTIIRVTGYGAVNADKNLSRSQQELMSIRAAKVDGYRAMAERIYGLSISGNTRVESLIVQDDKFRLFVDSYVQGAKVLDIERRADGSYQATLEVVLEPVFKRCLSSASFLRNNPACRQAVVHGKHPKRSPIPTTIAEDSGTFFVE